jgi:hypothetical protein
VDESKQRLDGVAPEFVWHLNQHAARPDLCIIFNGDAACEIDGLPGPAGGNQPAEADLPR